MDNFYLSIVVTTRNDNHGGDLLKRTQTFLNGLIIQFNKYKIKTELIIVEWNPPADKPLLKDVLTINFPNNYLTIRYIIVPEEIQRKFRFHDTIPLYQMIAKNVGIRRAKGIFILCTNIDLLFSDGLMLDLQKQNLQENTFYRADRCDVPKEIMEISDFNAQIHFAEKNVSERLGRKSLLKAHFTDFINDFYALPVLGKFISKSIFLIRKSIWGESKVVLYNLLFDACGDFTLMSKMDWEKIDGYAEIDLYSLHIDSMVLISALSLGMKQVVFKANSVTYHIHHKDGWSGFENPMGMINFLIKRPSLDWYSISVAGLNLIERKENWNINKANWGYNDIDFEEHIIFTKDK
jgi:hypothetical protein